MIRKKCHALAVGILLGLPLAYIGLIVFQSFRYSVVNVDAGYYLSISRDLLSGKVLYLDIYSVYSPLALYILACWSWITKNGGYSSYLSLIYLIHFLNSLLVFFVTRAVGCKFISSYCAGLLFALYCFVLEGDAILLEPFVVFFCLASFLVSLRLPISKSSAFVSGAFIGGAFLCKQYGVLGSIPPLWMIFSGQNDFHQRLKRVGSFFIGLMVSCLAFVGYFSAIKGLPILHLIKSLCGDGYVVSQNPRSATAWIVLAMLAIPPLLALIHLVERKNRPPFLLSVIGGFVGFLIPLTLSPFLHYYQLTLPYSMICVAFAFDGIFEMVSRSILSRLVRLGSLAICAFFPIYFSSFQFQTWIAGNRQAQQAVCKHLHESLPAGSSTIIFASPILYYLCDYHPDPALRLNYGFLRNYSCVELLRAISKSQVVVVEPLNKPYFQSLQDACQREGIGLYEAIKQSSHKLISGAGNPIEVWEN